MCDYLMRILEKIVNTLNRLYSFDLRIVNYNGQVYIKDLSYDYSDIISYDTNDLMSLKEFGVWYSGSAVLSTILTKREENVARANFNIT